VILELIDREYIKQKGLQNMNYEDTVIRDLKLEEAIYLEDIAISQYEIEAQVNSLMSIDDRLEAERAYNG
jgi:hypothetical protein